MDADETWRRCSSCKNPIGFGGAYYVCNVSTCNRKRTGLIFCDVSCWEVHLSSVNHRESWALERQAPSRAEWEREKAAEAGSASPAGGDRPRRRIVPAASAPAPASDGTEVPREVLIVASRLKSYVLARTGLKTSDGVLNALSDVVRAYVDSAAQNARDAERKTLLDRDIPAPNPRRGGSS